MGSIYCEYIPDLCHAHHAQSKTSQSLCIIDQTSSVAIEGRSPTFLEKIYTVRQKEKPAIHKAFMETLKSLLSEHCRPIIVSECRL